MDLHLEEKLVINDASKLATKCVVFSGKTIRKPKNDTSS